MATSLLKPRIAIFFLLALVSCTQPKAPALNLKQQISLGNTDYSFHLKKKSDSLYILHTEAHPAPKFVRNYRIPFPIYQFQIGDLNRDSKPDCLVGVVKPTPFDSVSRKRIFIYTLQENRFRKLWEGSRLVHPLQNFCIHDTPDGPEVWAQESEKNGLSLIACYRWGSFGLDFIRYQARNLDSISAAQLLFP